MAGKNETINYRLEKIEKSIEELHKVIIDSRIQAKDIEDIKSDIFCLSGKVEAQETKLQLIELKPTKEKAEKWQYIIDYVFKTLVAVAIGAFLFKFGIKG